MVSKKLKLGVIVFLIIICIFSSSQYVNAQVQTSISCTFSRNLALGSRGNDVIALQKILNLHSDTQVASSGSGSPGQETNYFGPATKKALIKYQEENSDQVLAPANLTSGTGFFGILTRQFIASQCRALTSSSGSSTQTQSSLNTSSKPVFSSIPTQSVVAGQSLSFTLSATSPLGDAITYGVEGSLNANSSLNPTTGVFTWNTGNWQSGQYSFLFQAKDQHNNVTSMPIEIDISANPNNSGVSQNIVSNTTNTTVSSNNTGLIPIVQNTPSNQTATFRIAGFDEFSGPNNTGENRGFKIPQATVTAVGSSATISLTLTKTSEKQVDASTVTETWASAHGEVTAQATLKTIGDDVQMQVTATVGTGWSVTNLNIDAPWVLTSSTSNLKTYSAFRGSAEQDWPQTGYAQQNSSTWPGYGYSPLAAFYNTQSGEGVGFMSFDDGIEPRQTFWVTGPGRIDPEINWQPQISNGASANTTLYLHHGFNMPTETFSFYRQNFLVPYMQRQGIPEATFNYQGILVSDGWPDNSDVAATVKRYNAEGANGYVQWAPPDGSIYYEPNPETLAWFPTLKAASQVSGNQVLGVLIDPFFKSKVAPPTNDPTNPAWFPGATGIQTFAAGQQSLKDPNVQNFLNRLKNDLVAQGVNFAFWDMGTDPLNGEGQQWINILKTWKQAGITIAAESSCDLNAYITGTTLFYGYYPNNETLTKVVTPQAHITLLMVPGTNATYAGPYPHWWEDVQARGYIPILYDDDMTAYAKEHRLSMASGGISSILASIGAAIQNLIANIAKGF